ncbi:hypothetical protein [Actinorhabdospora filicis]|uniref:hypothetical protein n=1 Tax=Actinorhabdospora filicis TaxID=1785913 RepID=UPI002556E7E9|nr:hypothetical protein [Actinorhabdospora filicis]
MAPVRRYETSRRASENDEPETTVTPVAPVPRARRHRYADEPEPAAPVAEAAVDAQLNRIAAFFRGADQERKATAGDGLALWDSAATQEIRPPAYQPEVVTTGEATPTEDDAVLVAVRELPGVNDAELYTDATGTRRLRLDLDSAADPDVVSAAAARLLADRLGVRAQPRTTQSFSFPRPPVGLTSRAVVEQVSVATAGFETAVEVALNVDGQVAIGRAAGPAVDWHVLRTAADATVDAVAGLIGERGRAVVEHASVVPAGALRVAVVVVLLLTEAGAEQLAGAAPVAGDSRQAMVHATMSALNRRLEVLLP